MNNKSIQLFPPLQQGVSSRCYVIEPSWVRYEEAVTAGADNRPCQQSPHCSLNNVCLPPAGAPQSHSRSDSSPLGCPRGHGRPEWRGSVLSLSIVRSWRCEDGGWCRVVTQSRGLSHLQRTKGQTRHNSIKFLQSGVTHQLMIMLT